MHWNLFPACDWFAFLGTDFCLPGGFFVDSARPVTFLSALSFFLLLSRSHQVPSLCMCSHIHVGTCVCEARVKEQAQITAPQTLPTNFFLSCFPVFVCLFGDMFSLPWHLPSRLRQLASKPQGPTCLPPQHWCENMPPHLAHCTWVWGIEFRCSCLQSKHFTNWIIFSATFNLLFKKTWKKSFILTNTFSKELFTLCSKQSKSPQTQARVLHPYRMTLLSPGRVTVSLTRTGFNWGLY